MAATIPLARAAMYSMPVPTTPKADRFSEFGRFLFALGMAMLGVQIPLVADFALGLAPVPEWLPMQLPLAYLSAAVLLGASVLVASGFRAQFGAIAAALLFLVWFVLLQLPRLAAHPDDGQVWKFAFEVLALFAATWLLAANAPPLAAAPIAAGAVWAPRIFGICLLVFGELHCVYPDYVASAIPAWLPAHTFFAYFTGAAHIAAGIAIVTGIQARLAATLLGAMFLSWVVLLHIPRVAAAPDSRVEWTSLLIAITLSGAAWLVANRFAPRAAQAPRKSSPVRIDSAVQTTSIEDATPDQASEAA